jgi:hypothetical protein
MLGRATALVLGIVCFVPLRAAAQAPPESDALKKLSFYVGSWSEAGQIREDPTKPFAAISGGETCKWAKGDFVVLCEERTSGPGGGWEGVYILGYDPASKKYHVHGIEKPGSSMHAVGRLEGDHWVWLTDPGPDGSQLRYTFVPGGAGTRSLAVEVRSADGWASIVNLTYSPKR